MSSNKEYNKNFLDIDGLDELFDTTHDEINESEESSDGNDCCATTTNELPESEVNNDPIIEVAPKSYIDEDDFVDIEIKNLLEKANNFLDSANILVTSSPDPETISAAASMLNALTKVINEINKPVILKKKFKYQKELEEVKQNGRKELTELKSTLNTKPSLPAGSTVYLQQNNKIDVNKKSSPKEDDPNEIISFNPNDLIKQFN